jgi:hypothetical protein
LLFDHPTIGAVSSYLSNELRHPGDDDRRDLITTGAAEPRSGSAVLAEIAELSDAEVERLVAGKSR